ncbi:unnamed protein product, partial [Owenia fusiformis]
ITMDVSPCGAISPRNSIAIDLSPNGPWSSIEMDLSPSGSLSPWSSYHHVRLNVGVYPLGPLSQRASDQVGLGAQSEWTSHYVGLDPLGPLTKRTFIPLNLYLYHNGPHQVHGAYMHAI